MRPVALFDFIQTKFKEVMGNSSSSSSGWVPSPSQGVPKKLSRSGYDITPLTWEERVEASKKLDGMAQYVALQHGTERPFTGKVLSSLLDRKD